MRLISLAAVSLLCIALLPARASSLDDQTFDQHTIDALQAKIAQAQPRELCFLYADLLHHMAELSLRQYSTGNVDQSAALLKQIGDLTAKIHLAVAPDNKRLKNAEILLRHSAFRLKEMLHSSSFEDQEMVATALAQVLRVQDEAMMKVFVK